MNRVRAMWRNFVDTMHTLAKTAKRIVMKVLNMIMNNTWTKSYNYVRVLGQFPKFQTFDINITVLENF